MDECMEEKLLFYFNLQANMYELNVGKQMARVYLSDSVFDFLSSPVRTRVPQTPAFSMGKIGFYFF